jgi:hypothetical protein
MAQKAVAAASSLLSRTRSAGQELRAGIEDIRANISKLKAKKVEIESIPPTLDIALARVDDWVDRLSYTARERMVEPGFFARGPKEYVRPEIYGQSCITAIFLVFLHRCSWRL